VELDESACRSLLFQPTTRNTNGYSDSHPHVNKDDCSAQREHHAIVWIGQERAGRHQREAKEERPSTLFPVADEETHRSNPISFKA
jgi:hypothetical protein